MLVNMKSPSSFFLVVRRNPGLDDEEGEVDDDDVVVKADKSSDDSEGKASDSEEEVEKKTTQGSSQVKELFIIKRLTWCLGTFDGSLWLMFSVVHRQTSCLRQSTSLCSVMTCAPRPNPLKAISCSCVSPHRVRICSEVKHFLK